MGASGYNRDGSVDLFTGYHQIFSPSPISTSFPTPREVAIWLIGKAELQRLGPSRYVRITRSITVVIAAHSLVLFHIYPSYFVLHPVPNFVQFTSRMEDLLTPLKTVLTSKKNPPEQHLIEASHTKQHTHSQHDAINSTGDALEALRSKPSLDLLTRVLQFLDPSKANNEGFNIKIPGPRAAQLIFVLVSDILPDYWGLLASPTHVREQQLLMRSLKSVSGIGAIIAHLRLRLDAGTGPKAEENLKSKETPRILEDLLNTLEILLRKDNFVLKICSDIAAFDLKPSQRNLLWKEFVSFVGGGRILSLAAEAHQYIRQQGSEIENSCWLGSGNQYSSWLGRNLIHMLTDSKKQRFEDLKQLAQLLGKTLSLGYTGELETDT